MLLVFMEVIDVCVMWIGVKDSDVYMVEWCWVELVEVFDDFEMEVEIVLEVLIVVYLKD